MVCFQIKNENCCMKTRNNYQLKYVTDYKCLGSYISDAEKHFKVRKNIDRTNFDNTSKHKLKSRK